MKRLLLLAALAASACSGPRRHPEAVQAMLDDNAPAAVSRVDPDVESVETELPQQDPTYRIGVNDVLHVQVPGHPGFGGGQVGIDDRPLGQRVLDNGCIHLPMLGEIQAAGRTVRELRADLGKRLDRFLTEPYVSIEVLRYESQKFFVLGAVARPGVFPVDGDTTLLEGLGEAGGVLPEGDLEGAYVVRGRTLLPISLADLLLRGDTRRNVFMRHGDLVYVPPAVRWQVYVLGEVQEPGPVAVSQAYGLSLVQALAEAGGIDPVHAARNEIRIFRGSWQAPKCFTLGVEDIYRDGDQIRLQPGDRIHVAPRGLATWSRTMQLLLPFLQPAIDGATAAAVLGN